MTWPLAKYRTVVFDCDGVLLDSNEVKTEAFRSAASDYGTQAAESLVHHHQSHGGISRYKKFEYFLDVIVPRDAPGTVGPNLDELLERYADAVAVGLRTCAVTPRLASIRQRTPDQRWLVVSGGDQQELRRLFQDRGLDMLFDGGVFGSPDEKPTILAREQSAENISGPAVYLGDSLYDHAAATTAGLDFIFISEWTEVTDWREHVKRLQLAHSRTVQTAFAMGANREPTS